MKKQRIYTQTKKIVASLEFDCFFSSTHVCF